MGRVFVSKVFGLSIKTNVADAPSNFSFFRFVANPDGEAVLQGDRIQYWSEEMFWGRGKIFEGI